MRLPTTSDKLGWTVHKRRQFEQMRAAKRREDHTDLITRLKVIFDMRTPESWRESLMADLPSLTARSKPWERHNWMPFRASNWVVNTIYEKLPQERNPRVRCSLLRLGARLLTRPPFTYSLRTCDEVAIQAMIDVLEQDLTRQERERSFGLLQEILERTYVEFEAGPRILQICMQTIRKFDQTGEYSSCELRRLCACMRFGVMETNCISPILDDDCTLGFIFEGIRFAEGRLHRSLSSLLATILECSTPEERIPLIARHYTQLRQAFHLMHVRDMADFMFIPEFAAIVATTPSLVDLIWSHARHECSRHQDDCWSAFSYDDYCLIATFILENALTDDERLQELLGCGFLSTAGHFASNRFDHSPRRVAIFREILAKHPEFKRRFKALTHLGPEGNMTAELGRTLADQTSKGHFYILEEESAEI